MSWLDFLPFFRSSFNMYLLSNVPGAGNTVVNPTGMNSDIMMKTESAQMNTFENVMISLCKCLEEKCYGGEKLIGGSVFKMGKRARKKRYEEQRFGDRQYCREPRTQRQPLNPERPELLGDSYGAAKPRSIHGKQSGRGFHCEPQLCHQ